MRIIDCHCHAGKGDGLSGPWDTSAPLSRFLQWSANAGIHQTNLFAALHKDSYRHANQQVAQIVQSRPERFFGFAFVHSSADKGQVMDMIRVAVEQYGFCGIKAHRHDARITREVCEAAQAYQIPVLYDVMGETSVVELLATEYPKVNFIIPHLSSFADDWQAQLSFIPMLERHPNVFTDTSGVRRFDLLEMAVKRAGAGKILFGTDGPWLHPAVELQKVLSLDISARDKQLILSDNFLRLTQKRKSGPSGARTLQFAGAKQLHSAIRNL
ncbi:MAG TPA: amidohydrolase [Saprospirales bacterium]|nr:amidohydrolase [Saprospirales bacterium]